MTKKIKCPDQKWFIRLSDGQVTKEQEEKLSLHLEECQRCQKLVDELNDISEYTSNTVRKDANTIHTDSKKFKERLSEIKSDVPSVASTSGYMDVMPWLTSSENGLARIDEFELTEFIGRGGMGVVFRCMDTKLQRPVAIKLMSPQLLVDEAACDRFLREARSAAKINHPNVVTVHAVNETQGLPYLVMELIEGDSLESMLVKDTPLSFMSVVEIARQTISGLSAAHQQGVLHRDIKPANIMLDSRSSQAKITDFGLACSMEGSKLTRTGFLVGTPEYLSPEQASGEKISERSDLFSMGSVIYAMCCGTSPFSSSSMLTTLDKVRSQRPKSLKELNPSLPIWFVSIIEKLLDKDPDSRFESANETLNAIDSHLTQSKNTVPHIDLSSTRKIVQQKHRQQNKFLLSIGLFTVATSLLIATIFWYFYSKKQQVLNNVSSANRNSQKEEVVEDNNHDLPDIDLENLRASKNIVISNFSQLAAALDQPVENLEVLVESGTRLDFSHCLEIEGKHVTIATTEDEPAHISVDFWHDNAFRVMNGSLKIENMEIVSMFGDEDIDEDEFLPLMFSEKSTVTIEHSTIACYDLTPCIELENSDATISNSRLINKESAILWLPNQDSQTLTINNSIIASPFAISANTEHQINISLDASTLISESCFIVAFGNAEKKICFDIEKCVLFSAESVIDIDDIETDDDWSLEDVIELIEFAGSNNRVSPILISGVIEDKEHFIESDVEALNQGNENNQILKVNFDNNLEIEDVITNLLDDDFGILKELDTGDGIGASLENAGPR